MRDVQSPKTRPLRKCRMCPVEFRPRTPNHSYCSVACRQTPCPVCGKLFERLEVRKQHCSNKCRGKAWKGSGNPNFGKRHPGIYQVPGEIRARYSEERMGAGNPAWKGGSVGNGRYRFQTYVSRWVLDGCRNCVCGAKATEAQHVVPRRWFRDVRMANFAENLIGLCRSCHRNADWHAYRRMRKGLDLRLRFSERLPASILHQLQTDGSVSRLPPGLDWSPLGNAAAAVLRVEWFDTGELPVDIARSA